MSTLKNVRFSALVLAFSNGVVIFLGSFILFFSYPACRQHDVLPVAIIVLASCVRIAAMVRTAVAQRATATTIISSADDSSAIRRERKVMYKTWLRWSRIVMAITVLQFAIVAYFMFIVARYVSHDGTADGCLRGPVSNGTTWKENVLILFMIMVCFMVVFQCFAGSDVLRWRSFYETEDAWKSHYQEVFDHGIREVLCCLGRARYMTVLEEDEVNLVAHLLGDLVAYRATGTGHLEFLAGLALLQRHIESPKSFEGHKDAPKEYIEEAVALHQYAEAAYTAAFA